MCFISLVEEFHMLPISRPEAVYTPEERAELNRVFDQLGSDDPSERTAAAQTAVRLLAEHGVTWAETSDAARCADEIGKQSCARTPPASPSPWGGNPDAWRPEAEFCLKKRRKMNTWEREFVENILAYRWPLSARQQNVLTNIGEKVRSPKSK